MSITQGSPLPAGPFGGINPPPFQSGKYYWPHFLMPNAQQFIAITANNLYRTWFYVPRTISFSGSWLFNTGTGDNAVVIRTGVWDQNGILKKDFGVITLTGAAALRTSANTVQLAGPAWYQVGMVSSGAPSLAAFASIGFVSGVGAVSANPLASMLGSFPAPLLTSGFFTNTPIGDTASFAYAAMPDPITTATATIMNNNSATSGTFPAIGLYI